MNWVPLHVHSQYSILNSTCSISSLVERAQLFGMESLAITDFCNLFGAIDFFKACRSKDIRPIIGIEVMVAPYSCTDKKKFPGERHGYPIVLLARNYEGYQNLCKIASLGYLEGFYYTPRVDQSILEKYAEGIICLAGVLQSRLAEYILKNNQQALNEALCWYKNTYKNYLYLELQRHEMAEHHIHDEKIDAESWLYHEYLEMVKNQKIVNARLLEIAQNHGIPYVATNGCHYMGREGWRAHEVLMNVQSGEPVEIVSTDSLGRSTGVELNPKRQVYPTHELYFKSPDEMKERFSDLPEAITETYELANLCDVNIDFQKKYYPVFVPPNFDCLKHSESERKNAVAVFLRQKCENNLSTRYCKDRLAKVQEKHPNKDPWIVIKNRLEKELDVIISKEMSDYLLIVYDFIAWAKQNKIPVGPGRGSGAGSIILYLLEITDIEPLRFDLFFERFINPERMSYPDIDVDICMERRSEVIQYTIEKYGSDKVAQIITFGTMKAKMAIKDVGRVLSVPLSKVNVLAKFIPDDVGITLEEALNRDAEFQQMVEEDLESQNVLKYARELEGSIRNIGVHAAGLIISGEVLTDHIPVCQTKGSELITTQYAMKPVESVGMLKIDFLGLKTLTSIQKAVDAIEKYEGKTIDWVNLPLEDKNTFALLNQGKTQGVFQLESSGMQSLAKQLHIDCFEEIIAVGALYRPGPMDMIPSFIARKHGREKIEIDHPLMEGIIKETYGIMVYQEQVMQIASQLAGYSLGEGDVLRRAMGKKDHKEMKTQRSKFIEGAIKKGVDSDQAKLIFDKIEKFASYGFNKSHAAAYGYLSYVTAFLKANYSNYWCAALMTCDSDDITKVAKHIHECNTIGIEILPPNVNESNLEFTAVSDGIRFSLLGIKGVGRGVVESLLNERNQKGPFDSLFDCLTRIDLTKVGRKSIENLIESGCFDFTGWTRVELLESVEPMFKQTLQQKKDFSKGVLDLFDVQGQVLNAAFLTPPTVVQKHSKIEMLLKEKEFLGVYLTGHPLDEYGSLKKKLGCINFSTSKTLSDQTLFKMIFIINDLKIRVSKRIQKKYVILTVSDGVDNFELPIWSKMYEEYQGLLQENRILFGVLQIEKDRNKVRVYCRQLSSVSEVNSSKIEAFNDLYQKVQADSKRSLIYKNKQKSLGAAMPSNELKKLNLTFNIDKVRLSDVVKIKKLIENHSGSNPLNLLFISNGKSVGKVVVDETAGIAWGPSVKSQLEQYECIQSFSFDT